MVVAREAVSSQAGKRTKQLAAWLRRAPFGLWSAVNQRVARWAMGERDLPRVAVLCARVRGAARPPTARPTEGEKPACRARTCPQLRLGVS